VNWIELLQDRVQCWVLLNSAAPLVPVKQRMFWLPGRLQQLVEDRVPWMTVVGISLSKEIRVNNTVNEQRVWAATQAIKLSSGCCPSDGHRTSGRSSWHFSSEIGSSDVDNRVGYPDGDVL
jgi:hypothetical protein